MLTAAIELEQEDVNPDDYLEPKQQQPHPAAKLPQQHSSFPAAIEAEVESSVHQRNSDSPRKSSALLPSLLPLRIARNNNDSKNSINSSSNNNGWGATSLQQQRNSIIKLERRYRKDKENSWEEENSACFDTEPRQEGARKRSFLTNIEQDICKRSKGPTQRKKLCLSLTNPAGKAKKRPNKTPRKSEDKPAEKSISASPVLFEEEEEVQLEAVTQAVEGDDSSSRRSSQTIDWDKVEVCAEEDNEDHQETTSPTSPAAPFNYDSLVASKLAYPHYARKVYPSNLASRLSLSKKQSQIDVSEAHPAVSVLNSTSRLSLSKKQFQSDLAAKPLSAPPPPLREKRKQEDSQQQELGAKRAKQLVDGGVGEDDMSIHHHQQQHNHHYHLQSCNSSSSNNNASSASFPESTSSILLLARAAAAGTADSPPSSKMSGHSHYTRSKPSHLQSRYSLASATDLAIAASLNEIPRSKVSSLQGRVDTGTATELAIAQSLSEDHQQNILNNAANSSAGTSSSVVNLSSPATTPASIAAAANMNNTLATLCNIGNSCYLNSVLYTLRFAPNFIHNLHHLIEDMDSVVQRLSQNKLKSSSLGRNIPGLHGASGRSWSSKDLASLGGGSTGNSSSSSTLTGTSSSVTSSSGGATTNGSTGTGGCISENLPPKSNRQIVTEQLHELFQNLHRNEAIETPEPFHAGNILRAVQDVSATFEGNQQQDAHEFLMCLLDSIRESCQALNKIITDHPDLLVNACPPVPECIETFVPETKSSSARVFFRRRKESVKTAKQAVTANGATLPKGSTGAGGDGSSTAEQLANLKNALFAKPCSALDEQLIRERVQALGLDFFRDDFEGVTVAKTKCLACETCTEQKETMIDIAIPITASEVSDAAKNPQLFYQNSCITQEYFRGDNKYRCEVCCGYREAIRSISFEVLPRQLILQLKRFNGDMEKINSYIPTPFVLRCFCNTCLPKPDCDKPHIYRLYSVITHVGARMSVGHYIAYTSSLDVHAEYLGCGKDRRRQLLLSGGSIDGGIGGGGGGGVGGSFGAGTTGSTGKSSEKSTSGQLKKLFSSKKASSAGDMSKKIKNNNKLNLINGIEGLNLINGSGGAGSNNTASFGSQSGSNSPSSNGTPTGVGGSLASRIPCAGLNCCGIHLKNSHLSLYGNSSSSTNSSGSLVATSGEPAPHTNGTAAAAAGDGSGDGPTVGAGAANPSSTSSSPAGSGTPHSGGSTSSAAIIGNGLSAATTPAAFEQSLSQQLWHMCDDDKIKIMSQTEFEELLSPNRRHVITPYLLFYARYDLVRQKDNTTVAATDGKPVDGATPGMLPDGSAVID